MKTPMCFDTCPCELSLSYEAYADLKQLSHDTKNLRNQAVFAVRRHYFQTSKYLGYMGMYDLSKTTDNFKILGHSIAKSILRHIDAEFKSYFGALKAYKAGTIKRCPSLPGYLEKDGFYILPTDSPSIRKRDYIFKVSFSKHFNKYHN